MLQLSTQQLGCVSTDGGFAQMGQGVTALGPGPDLEAEELLPTSML